MEVASPLTFQPAGTKRSFMCGSPPPMDVSDDYVVQQSKRRRFGDTSPLGFAPSFGASMHTSPFAARAPGGSAKRSRTDSGQAENGQQAAAAEMASLKQENSKLQGSLVLLQGSHDKATHENKLLKRLVTHQHEKQNQAHVELEAARKYKEEAQDAITKMEQMILQLRYHLQTQQTPMTDMGGFHRHSDVY